jgi:hypothetical protein
LTNDLGSKGFGGGNNFMKSLKPPPTLTPVIAEVVAPPDFTPSFWDDSLYPSSSPVLQSSPPYE